LTTELGINILAKTWDEYDCKNLAITTRYFTKDRLESIYQKIIDQVKMKKVPVDPA